MRVLVAGQSGCDFGTLKRLNLIAEDIAFVDYPSVNFGGWGMIGHDSWFRRVLSQPSDPVRISVHRAPAGPPGALLLKYLEPDVSNHEFRNVFLDGMRDPRFVSKFFQLDGDYRIGESTVKGSDIVRALREDESLRHGDLQGAWDLGANHEFVDVYTSEGRRSLLARELMVASVHVTTALVVSESIGHVPVADDGHFGRLLALRTGSGAYVGTAERSAAYIGLEIMRAVVPDEALDRMSIKDILDYRAATRDAYNGWLVELNGMVARLDEIKIDNLAEEVPRIIAGEIRPRMLEYRNELKSVRDRMFAGILKDLTSWKMPTLTIAAVTQLNVPAALAAFAAGAHAALPHLVEYYTARRDAGRKHSISYVVGVTRDLGGGWDADVGLLRSGH